MANTVHDSVTFTIEKARQCGSNEYQLCLDNQRYLVELYNHTHYIHAHVATPVSVVDPVSGKFDDMTSCLSMIDLDLPLASIEEPLQSPLDCIVFDEVSADKRHKRPRVHWFTQLFYITAIIAVVLSNILVIPQTSQPRLVTGTQPPKLLTSAQKTYPRNLTTILHSAAITLRKKILQNLWST